MLYNRCTNEMDSTQPVTDGIVNAVKRNTKKVGIAAEEKPRLRRIGSLVNQLMSRRGYAQVAANEHLHQSLVTAVGESLASSCRIGNLRAGVLQIYACDSVTLQELNFQKRPILRQLQKDFADGNVTDVRLRIQSNG